MALRQELTPRNADILALVRRGMAQTEIAALLGIAKNTVKAHLRIMLAREGVENQIALVVRAGGLRFNGDRRLTKAESRVVKCVFAGLRNREIAEVVGLSVELELVVKVGGRGDEGDQQ